jgi:hypothetical protein
MHPHPRNRLDRERGKRDLRERDRDRDRERELAFLHIHNSTSTSTFASAATSFSYLSIPRLSALWDPHPCLLRTFPAFSRSHDIPVFYGILVPRFVPPVQSTSVIRTVQYSFRRVDVNPGPNPLLVLASTRASTVYRTLTKACRVENRPKSLSENLAQSRTPRNFFL